MRNIRFFSPALFAALLLALPSGAFAQTEVPVPCTGVPVNDGAALIWAYNAIVGNSATSPFVVRPDPCLYDLGTNTLTIRNFIDLIGLGRNDTIITSQVDRGTNPNQGTITIPPGVDAEVKNVTIRNEGTNQGYAVRNASNLFVMSKSIVEATSLTDAVAIYTEGRLVGAELLLRAFTVGEEVIAARSVGLEDVGGSTVFSNGFMTVGGIACTQGFGVRYDNSAATLQTLNIFVDCLSATGVAIRGGSDPNISNVIIGVEASSVGTGVGIDVQDTGTIAIVADTQVRVDASATGIGVRNTGQGSTIQMANVDARAETGATKIGLDATNGLCVVDRSTFEGSGTGGTSLNVGASGNVRVGASKLNGPRTIVGPAVCVGAYDGAYLPIPPTCV